MTRYVFDEQSQTFIPGKAKPELLREDLRKLPSEYVTKEIEEDAKVHEIDPPHVRRPLTKDLRARETDPKPSLDDKVAEAEKDPWFEAAQIFRIPDADARIEDSRVTQPRVDWIRFSTMRQKWKTAQMRVKSGADYRSQLDWLESLQYLWFPKNDVRICDVREGKPPPPLSRPTYLRHIDLVCDVRHWPPRIVDFLWKKGITLPNYEESRSLLEYEAGIYELFNEDADEEASVNEDLQ